MAQPLQQFDQFISWMQTQQQVSANPQTKPTYRPIHTTLLMVLLPINGGYFTHILNMMCLLNKLRTINMMFADCLSCCIEF